MLLKQKAEIEKETRKLQSKYETLFESKIEGKITELDYKLKKDILDNKIAYNDEIYNQVVTDIYYNKDKAKTFHKILEELKEVDLSINKLDCIRAVALRCDVDKMNDNYKLNIRFKFQV